jgi:thiol-disulfide isomerase/thioredoxin
MRQDWIELASCLILSSTMAAAMGCTKPTPADNAPVVAAIADPAAESAAGNANGGQQTDKQSSDSVQTSEEPSRTGDDLEAFAKSISKELGEKIDLVEQGKEVDFAPSVKRLTDRLGNSTDASLAEGVISVARTLEMYAPAEKVRPLYNSLNDFADRIAFNNPGVASNVRKMAEHQLTRLSLVGTKPTIEGTTVDGTKLDWSKYQGKVVLLDFWATWCGPCLEELPNVKKVYSEYHDKGFDVIGVSLDDSPQDVVAFQEKEKLPWATLFPTGPDRVWESPLAKEFLVEGIPATFLFDRSGKLVSISARGKQLEAQVKKLLEK